MTAPTKAPKLADVAAAAGVSQGTVSNVFNRPELVRPEVRQRVHAAALSIGYGGPDPRGRLLRAGKVNAVGVATTESLTHFFDDPFTRVLMEGITEACEANGTGISLISANEEALSWNVGSALVDGFILICLSGAERLVEHSRQRQLPFIAIDFEAEDQDILTISVDNVEGGRMMARHLCGLGHRHMAILSFEYSHRPSGRRSAADFAQSRMPVARDRVAGIFEVLAAHGIKTETIPLYETMATPETVHPALAELFSALEPPTAIVALSDRIALVVLDWMASQGLSVPGDVSVIGFDDVPEAARSRPPLTTIVQPIREIGHRAVRAILEGPESVMGKPFVLELRQRASTAPPR